MTIMVEYLKGEVCGVDNCRVTQYYLEDGQLFCRNGHRKEVKIAPRHIVEFKYSHINRANCKFRRMKTPLELKDARREKRLSERRYLEV